MTIAIKCNDPVRVTCYGQTKTWEREDAIRYYQSGAMFCDGSERERYTNIYFQLLEGKKEVSDI